MALPEKIKGIRLSVYVDSAVRWHGQPYYQALVKRCQEVGIAGATVVNCAEGFGSHRTLHTSRLLALTDNLPVLVQIIERQENTEHILESLGDILSQRLVTLEEIDILHFQ